MVLDDDNSVLYIRMSAPSVGRVVLIFLAIALASANNFCSSYCKDTNCDGEGTNQCKNKCNTNWQLSSPNCIPQSAYGWTAYDTSPDIGGSLTISGHTGASSCTGLTYYEMAMNQSATISNGVGGITTPFFEISVTVTAIAVDPWKGWDRSNSRFYLDFSDGIITPVTSSSSKVSSPYKKVKYCYDNSAS